MSLRRLVPVGSLTLTLMLTLVVTLVLRADDVQLVPNTTVKEASAGKVVRGTIQSETTTEVVVKLGATTIKVPTEEVVSIKYDGQPQNMALAEISESQGAIAKAVDL